MNFVPFVLAIAVIMVVHGQRKVSKMSDQKNDGIEAIGSIVELPSSIIGGAFGIIGEIFGSSPTPQPPPSQGSDSDKSGGK